jgi:hypothetical protein
MVHAKYFIVYFQILIIFVTQTLTPLYEVQKAAMLSHKVKNKNTNPNLRCNNRRNGDKIDTHALLFTLRKYTKLWGIELAHRKIKLCQY